MYTWALTCCCCSLQTALPHQAYSGLEDVGVLMPGLPTPQDGAALSR